jgi:hypothetical protein
MNPLTRKIVLHGSLLVVLATGAAVVATSFSPVPAIARSRSMDPPAGDPDDTNDGPAPGPAKAGFLGPGTERSSAKLALYRWSVAGGGAAGSVHLRMLFELLLTLRMVAMSR